MIRTGGGWQVLDDRKRDTNGEGAEDNKWEPRRQYVYGDTYIDEVLIFDKDTHDDGDCTDGGGSSRHLYCQQARVLGPLYLPLGLMFTHFQQLWFERMANRLGIRHVP